MEKPKRQILEKNKNNQTIWKYHTEGMDGTNSGGNLSTGGVQEAPVPGTLVELLNQISNEIKASSHNLESILSQKFTEEIQKVNENIDNKMAPLTAEIQELQVRVEGCEENVNEIKEQRDLEKRIIEKEKRKKNIIIHGISVGDGPNRTGRATDLIVDLVQNRLEVTLNKDQIDFVKVLKGPIVIGFTTWNKKLEILKNAKKLKGTEIFMGQDYPPDVLKIRKALIPIMNKHRKEGRHAIINYDKLVVGKKGEVTGSNQKPTQTEEDEGNMETSDIEDEEFENTTDQTTEENIIPHQIKDKNPQQKPTASHYETIKINNEEKRKKFKLQSSKLTNSLKQGTLTTYIKVNETNTENNTEENGVVNTEQK